MRCVDDRDMALQPTGIEYRNQSRDNVAYILRFKSDVDDRGRWWQAVEKYQLAEIAVASDEDAAVVYGESDDDRIGSVRRHGRCTNNVVARSY